MGESYYEWCYQRQPYDYVNWITLVAASVGLHICRGWIKYKNMFQIEDWQRKCQAIEGIEIGTGVDI